MFTGIVECMAGIRSRTRKGGLVRLTLQVPIDLGDSRVGDSFCVQGICLTAVAISGRELEVEVSEETLQRTTLGSYPASRPVNVERALRLSDRLGGHLVTGHVDGTGRVLAVQRQGANVAFRIEAGPGVARYLVEKGSICVDGVSLTVGKCGKDDFMVHLIPHTLQETTLQFLRPGERVNLEADIIGKYVERLLGRQGDAPRESSGGIELATLERYGFAGLSKD